MKNQAQSDTENRRHFLTHTLPGMTSLCLGCTGLLSLTDAQDSPSAQLFQARISENIGMTYEQMFQFIYVHSQLAIALTALAEHIGRAKFLEMLKTSIDEAWIRPEIQNRFYGTLDKRFWEHIVKWEFLKDTEEVRIVRYTECLWAKTFRDAGEAEIGYAVICHPDYAMAKSRKELLVRPQCQMLGDDCCYFQYTKEV